MEKNFVSFKDINEKYSISRTKCNNVLKEFKGKDLIDGIDFYQVKNGTGRPMWLVDEEKFMSLLNSTRQHKARPLNLTASRYERILFERLGVDRPLKVINQDNVWTATADLPTVEGDEVRYILTLGKLNTLQIEFRGFVISKMEFDKNFQVS